MKHYSNIEHSVRILKESGYSVEKSDKPKKGKIGDYDYEVMVSPDQIDKYTKYVMGTCKRRGSGIVQLQAKQYFEAYAYRSTMIVFSKPGFRLMEMPESGCRPFDKYGRSIICVTFKGDEIRTATGRYGHYDEDEMWHDGTSSDHWGDHFVGSIDELAVILGCEADDILEIID